MHSSLTTRPVVSYPIVYLLFLLLNSFLLGYSVLLGKLLLLCSKQTCNLSVVFNFRARKYNLYCRSCKIICRRYNRSNTKRILFKVADYNHKRVKQALDEIYF